MRVAIKPAGPKCFVLVFTPESADDEITVQAFGEVMSRAHLINHRGYAYMSRDVEFVVQPRSSGD